MALVWVRAAGRLLLGMSRTFWAGVAGLWAGLIWWLSTHEGGTGDGTFWMMWLGNLAHAPLFGLLALWLALAAPRRAVGGWARLSRLDRTWIFVAVAAWGAMDEVHQSFVPGRDASVLDLMTDSAGALSVLAVAATAGLASASAVGVRRRLGLGILACLLTALSATLGSM